MAMDIIRFVDRIAAESLPTSTDVADTFTRTAAGLGSVETGGVAWTTAGSTFSTDGSKAIVAVNSVDSSRRAWVPTTFTDHDVLVSFRVPVTPTGASIACGAMGRLFDSVSFYLAELLIGTDNSVTMRVGKFVDGSYTSLATGSTGITHGTGKTYRVRFQMRATALRARGWDSAGSEPSTWQVEVADTTYASGNPGFRSVLTFGNTNTLPINIEFDDFAVMTGGVGPTTRLDLNDGTTWGVNYNGTDFSPPPLKQAWSSTLLTDGERLSAAAYANRQIQLNMDLMASTQDAIAAELQKLWRELNRPSNFLMYQPNGAANPVFFRTLRSSSTRVTDFPSGAMRNVQVTIDAEPFGYGPKEQLPAATVGNDPTAGSNPMYFDVNAPKGDVETPLYMTINGASVIKAIGATDPPNRPMTAIAVRRRGTPANTPFHLGAEAMEGLGQVSARRSTDMSGSTTVLNANPFFETDVSNWTTTTGTMVRDTTQFFSGVASMKFTPTGGIAQAFVQSNSVTIDPTKLYAATAWVRCAVARTIDVAINWFTSGDVYVSTTTFGGVAVAANTWTLIGSSGTGKPPATAAKAAMTISLDGTPPNTHITFIDEAQLSLANYMRVPNSMVAPTYTSVAQVALYPAAASVDARGTYRVFMRYRYDGGGSADDLMCRLWWGNGIFNGNVVLKRQTGTTPYYADLGLVNIPGGYDPVSDGVSGVEVPAEGIYLNLQVEDTPGSTSASNLDIDHLLFIPADDRFLLVRWQNRINAPAPTDVLLDSNNGQVYSRNASGQPGMLTGHELAGGPPMVAPGVSNRVYVCLDVGTERTPPTDKNALFTVTPHYWPRYLTVRPVTS